MYKFEFCKGCEKENIDGKCNHDLHVILEECEISLLFKFHRMVDFDKYPSMGFIVDELLTSGERSRVEPHGG